MQQGLTIQFKTKNTKQIEACEAWLDNSVEQITYGGSKGGGKSFLGASLIFADALMYPDTHYFIARKELNDLRKYTTPTIHEVFQKWGLDFDKYCTYNGQDNYFKLHNGSKVYYISCDDEPRDPLFERFGSMQMTRGWLEEAGEIPESAKSNLWLAIGRWKNDVYNLKKKLLITCNPKKNWLKREFVDPFKDGTLPPSKRFIQAHSSDNVYLPEGYVDTLSNIRDAVTRDRLFAGNWEYDDDADCLLNSHEIAMIFKTPPETASERFMTIDPAFSGKDEAVIFLWNGWSVTEIISFPTTDHSTLMQMIDLYAKANDIPRRNIISDAVGNAEYLPTMLPGIRGFIGGSSPLPDLRAKVKEMEKPFFTNLRAQCIYETALKIQLGKVSFPNDNERVKTKLIEELEQWKKRDVDEDKKFGVISKPDIKEIIGRSTDYSDALYMRAFFELDSERSGATAETIRRQKIEQNRIPQNKWRI